ncbi:MAG TPA: LCP family protein [Candidatus Baltobacteraceae bacterium]
MPKHDTPEFNDRPMKRKVRWDRRIALIVACTIVGLFAVLAGFAIVQHKNLGQVLAEMVTPSPQEVFGKNHLLVLVVGLDYDYTSKDEEYSTQGRSDVIKAINLDFDHQQIYEVDVPRDMVATMPGGRQAKINEAMSDGGIKEAQQVIAQFLGIPGFDRYVILRVDSMQQIITAIGGVNVNVEDSSCVKNHQCKNQDRLDYVDTWGHLNIHLKPGYQHLNGTQALGYSRYREDWCGDPCRLMRQSQVVRAMLDKIKSDKLNTMLHAGQLISIVKKNTTTNMNQDELKSLAIYFSSIGQGSIHVAQVPKSDNVTLPDGGAATVADRSATARLVQTMLIAPPTPAPSHQALKVAAIDPSLVRVEVQNASGVKGAAHRIAAILAKDGFKIGAIGNAPNDGRAVTEVHQHSPVEFSGARVLEALPVVGQKPTLVRDIDTDTAAKHPQQSDVTVVVGTDLAEAPPVAAATP